MALSKYKLGTLIQESFRKNSEMKFDVSYVRGISNNKQIVDSNNQSCKQKISRQGLWFYY